MESRPEWFIAHPPKPLVPTLPYVRLTEAVKQSHTEPISNKPLQSLITLIFIHAYGTRIIMRPSIHAKRYIFHIYCIALVLSSLSWTGWRGSDVPSRSWTKPIDKGILPIALRCMSFKEKEGSHIADQGTVPCYHYSYQTVTGNVWSSSRSFW